MVGGPPIEPHAFPASNQGRLSTQVGLWRVREFREMVIVKMCKVRGSTLPVVSHYISENNMQEKKGHHARLTHFSMSEYHGSSPDLLALRERWTTKPGNPQLHAAIKQCFLLQRHVFFNLLALKPVACPTMWPQTFVPFRPRPPLPRGAWTRIHGGLGDAASRLSSWPAQGDAAILDATPTVSLESSRNVVTIV